MTHSSVKVAKMLVDSVEFSEWLMYWELAAELTGAVPRESAEEDKANQLRAFAAVHNAKLAAKEPGKVTRERR